MRIKSALVFLVVATFATTVLAETKTSGTTTCKADPATPVALTDQPNHSFMVGRSQCTWTGFAVGGQDYKTGISTDLDEISGDTTSFNGYHVATLANGDTATCSYKGSGKMKDGKAVSGEGTWTFTSGTGKAKGIKGKGTFKGTANADGSMNYKVEGEYSLP
jgi:hypothetical protein